jgi:DNA-binding NarL/FixJ family response regulator
MPLSEAIAYALATDVPAAHEPTTMVSAFGEPASAMLVSRVPVSDTRASIGLARAIAAPAGPATNQITQRECEVAALVARGFTNRRIAEALTITEGTAACHVKHILARLVLDSRVQIATWAIEHGLHQTPTPVWGATR